MLFPSLRSPPSPPPPTTFRKARKLVGFFGRGRASERVPVDVIAVPAPANAHTLSTDSQRQSTGWPVVDDVVDLQVLA